MRHNCHHRFRVAFRLPGVEMPFDNPIRRDSLLGFRFGMALRNAAPRRFNRLVFFAATGGVAVFAFRFDPATFGLRFVLNPNAFVSLVPGRRTIPARFAAVRILRSLGRTPAKPRFDPLEFAPDFFLPRRPRTPARSRRRPTLAFPA